MTIYVLSGFNNYYNRVVKKFDTINEYESYVLYIQQNFNFVPNDGVNTKVVLGSNVNLYDGTGDYLLVVNEFNEIVSRWFIIESVRDRAGQYTLTLYRDLVVDYYDIIKESPMFIEKATLSPNDPLIFNSENVTVNQIKQNEFLIENNLKTPWIVAYLSREDGEGNYNSFKGSFTYKREPISPDYTLESLDEYPFSNWVDNKYRLSDSITFQCDYVTKWFSKKSMVVGPNGRYGINGESSGTDEGWENWPRGSVNDEINPEELYDKLMVAYNSVNTVDSNGIPYNSLTNIGTVDGFALLSKENGKTIKVGNRYYEISTELGSTDPFDIPDSEWRIKIVKGTALYETMFNEWVKKSGLSYDENTILKTNIYLPLRIDRITLKIKEIPARQKLSYNFSYTKAATTDAVYEIIATPLKNIELTVGENLVVNTIGSMGLQWFQALYTQNNTKVYDVQIVPYIALDDNDARNYEFVTLYDTADENIIKTVALKLQKSSFNLLLETPQEVQLNNNIKIGSETELWRLTSPNGVGSFDFNPYKNKSFNFIEVDCTLIPINPYIKINPFFNVEGLYGGDYNDFRGLICGGDFSVALTSSEWQTYQQQNKNFQAIFDRQIKSLDYQNKVALGQDITSAIVGAGSGAAAGALAGSMIMPGVGTLAGGIIGGVASAGAGVADIFLNKSLRDDSKDLTQDMFRMNLGNIKARAETLTKTTSYNINNKYFPYIELFSCTEREKEAVARKIAYNGMTTNVIGKIEDYINNRWSYNDIKSEGYIKGQLIRFELPVDNKEGQHGEDFHVVNAISGELYKGVYLKGDYIE